MFKGLSNLAGLLANAQNISGKMQNISSDLKHKRAIGKAGGDLVEVEVNGLGQVLRVTLAPSLVERGDRELIEDLLPAAINAAVGKARELHAEAVQGLTGGMELPGLKDMLAKFSGGASDEEDVDEVSDEDAGESDSPAK